MGICQYRDSGARPSRMMEPWLIAVSTVPTNRAVRSDLRSRGQWRRVHLVHRTCPPILKAQRSMSDRPQEKQVLGRPLSLGSGLVAAAATAAGVGVFDREAAAHQAVAVVDLGAVEEWGRLVVRHHAQALIVKKMFVRGVVRF
jgi:hypothetical protein